MAAGSDVIEICPCRNQGWSISSRRPAAEANACKSRQPPASGDEVPLVADGLGVTTADGDVTDRDGLAFGAGLTDAVGAADAGLTAADDGDGDGDGDDLTGADDRAGAGTPAAGDSGLTSK